MEIKSQIDATEVFIADLIACSTFRAPLRPSSGAQVYYTVVAACGISCCKNVKSNFVSFCGICVLSLKCRVLSRFVTRCDECCGGRVWVFLVGFL